MEEGVEPMNASDRRTSRRFRSRRFRTLQVILIPAFAAGILAGLFTWRLSSAAPSGQAPASDPGSAAVIERGRYLVTAMSCNDCHTPWKMGQNGPEPDMSRMLSGHPEQMQMPPAPQLPMPWMGASAATNTAWAGPWGVSFTANLTPDDETGIGRWTEEDFIATFRTGRVMGRGRPLLPPMPYPNVASLKDQDLHAIFLYLRSIPPIKNHVPEPLPPQGTPPGR